MARAWTGWLVAVVAIGIAAWEHTRVEQLRQQLADQQAVALHAPVAVTRGTFTAAPKAEARATPSSRPVANVAAQKPIEALDEKTKATLDALHAIEARGMLDYNYADLFQNLRTRASISPAQIEKLKDLLIARQSSLADARDYARKIGGTAETEQSAVRQVAVDSDREIASLLGQAGYDRYLEYQRTGPQRVTANLLRQSLSYTDSPLTEEQYTAVVRALSGGGTRSGFVPVTDKAAEQLKGVLSDSQFEALGKVRQHIEARDAVRKLEATQSAKN